MLPRGQVYLVKERVVSLLDPCPVGLVAHRHLHHRLDVVTTQLTGLDDPNTDLEDADEQYKWRQVIVKAAE